MISCAIIGAIKIKDGLFVGDEFSAKVGFVNKRYDGLLES